MTIIKRTYTGWSEPVENKAKFTCDECGSKLWIDPGGGKYCNALHRDEGKCDCAATATGTTDGIPDCDQCHMDKEAFA